MSKTATVRSYELGPDGGEVMCDTGGGANVTAEHFGPAGDDSPPLPGDTVALKDGTGAGRKHAVGYDDATPKTALPGEKRIYGRDAEGTKVNEIWLKRDGTIELTTEGIVFTFGRGIARLVAKTVILDGDDVTLGRGGAQVAVVGSPVAVSVLPVPPLGETNLVGTGQILGGVAGVSAG